MKLLMFFVLPQFLSVSARGSPTNWSHDDGAVFFRHPDDNLQPANHWSTAPSCPGIKFIENLVHTTSSTGTSTAAAIKELPLRQRASGHGGSAAMKLLMFFVLPQDGKDVSACAPQKDVCGSCEARFYAKQQFLVCSAGCNRRFHCKCLNVTHEEYNFYMKSGTSAFKCSGCTRRSSASTRNDAAAGIGGVVPAPVAFVEPSNVTLDDGSVPPALLRLIESLSSKLDIVTAELKCLRADNNSLRSEVLHLRKSVHERMPLPSSSSTMYASVAALPPAAPTSVLRPRAADSLLNTVPGTNLGGAGLESSPSRGARAAGEKDAVDDGYTTVGPRRRTKPSAGTAKPSKCKADQTGRAIEDNTAVQQALLQEAWEEVLNLQERIAEMEQRKREDDQSRLCLEACIADQDKLLQDYMEKNKKLEQKIRELEDRQREDDQARLNMKDHIAGQEKLLQDILEQNLKLQEKPTGLEDQVFDANAYHLEIQDHINRCSKGLQDMANDVARCSREPAIQTMGHDLSNRIKTCFSYVTKSIRGLPEEDFR
ncbi:uncharacterized protein ISCGN_001138 [Ixodes scapularis]